MKIDPVLVIEHKFSRPINRLQKVWLKIVEPSASIKDPDIRNRARLFNGLLVMIILVTIPVLGIQIWHASPQEIATSSTIRAIVVGMIVALVNYLLNRIISSYRLMTYTAIALGFVSIFAVALTSNAPHIEILFLIFLPLVSTTLFSLWGTFTLCVVTLTGLVIFGLIVPDLPREVLKNMVVFTALTQVFILFVAQRRNHLERDRQRLALEEARNVLLKSLISNLSHDFRTPLSIININAYLAERIEDRQQQREKIDMIVAQTMRLDKLLDDILTISRLEHAPLFGQERFELNDLLRQVIEHMQPKAADKHLKMISELASGMPSVHANRDDLQRVFASILENSVAYTPAGGSITVRTLFTADRVVTEAIDTGIGIDPADLPMIFDHFFRGDRARSMDTGVGGLGLSIARRVVEMHQGKITVESLPDQGSTFRITIPLTVHPS